jgi:hypothetical protein
LRLREQELQQMQKEKQLKKALRPINQDNKKRATLCISLDCE